MDRKTIRDTVVRTCREQGISADRSPRDTIRLTDVGESAPAEAFPPTGLGDIGDLRIEETIARGGMGLVRVAEQRSLERSVAVKTLLPERQGEPHASGLLREARLTGRLEHPNIVPVHGLGWRDVDGPVLVMKRIEGVAWSELIADPGHVFWQGSGRDERLARHVEILMEVCHAVEFAHSRGVIHRDVKPANVMVGAYGEVVLLDWGVAYDGEPGPGPRMVGTPAYMAPEMLALGDDVTPQTDVFLLGATLHEVLTGVPRHDGPNLHEVLCAAALSEPARYPDDVPAELAAICNRACAPRPADRYRSARELRDALLDFLRHRSSVATAERARDHLVELERLVAGGTEDRVSVHHAFSAARFGFDQAIREWSHNAAAWQGLQACLESLIRYELRRGNHPSAEPLIAELPEPRPALEAELARVRASAAVRDRASEQLAAMRHDLRVHGIDWSRGWLAVANGVGTATLLVLAGELIRQRGPPSPGQALAYLGAGAVIQVVSIVVFRERLFDTRIYRGLMLVLASLLPMLMVAHVLGMLVDASMPQLLLVDLMMVVVVQVALAAALDRVFWASAAIGIVTSAIALAWIDFALHIAAVGYLLHTAWITWALRPREA